ncbi:unnamed protein product [Moneuplotes crassus]|uniref:Uncharacterized protein n=1 Tax=Euplotes crassus TaxID=5936 RepID=A0AAD2D7E3_EUPCR|nr:unnamed protein product [Moneuplotes crassus]
MQIRKHRKQSDQQEFNVEIPAQLLPAKVTYLAAKQKKKTGKWSDREHARFVNYLKIYGKNWEKLEGLIPTRNSLQIKSHCQKYLNDIKKEFNTEDPMDYFVKHNCNEPLFNDSDKSSEKFRKEIPNLTDCGIVKKVSTCIPNLIRMAKPIERSQIQEFQMKNKKRYHKYQRKCLKDSSSSESITPDSNKSAKSPNYYCVSLATIKEKAQISSKPLTRTDENADKVHLIKRAFELNHRNSPNNLSAIKPHQVHELDVSQHNFATKNDKIEIKSPCFISVDQDDIRHIIPLDLDNPVRVPFYQEQSINLNQNNNLRQFSGTTVNSPISQCYPFHNNQTPLNLNTKMTEQRINIGCLTTNISQPHNLILPPKKSPLSSPPLTALKYCTCPNSPLKNLN